MSALYTMAAILLFVALFAVIAWIPTWLLWNWLMPVVFGLPEITIWQALGLLVLFSLLIPRGGSSSSTRI